MKSTLSISLLAIIIAAGCSPSLSPLYRDFEHKPDHPDIDTRITRALSESDWNIVSDSDSTLVTTEARTFRQWGLYRVEASLQVTQLGGDYVRVLINPYRVYFTGRRSKVPYLKKRLGRAVLKDLREEFEEEGLVAVGTIVERDKEDRQGS